VFALLSPKAFQACFRDWVASVRTVYEEEVIAIDGETLRRSHDRKGSLGPLHMVSAWATRNGLVLGQQATDAKSPTRSPPYPSCSRCCCSVENNLHRSLEVAFREDDSRIRERNLAENAAVLRRIALGLLKADKSTEARIKTKCLTAGWNEDYNVALNLT
jgi:hypothetical protein